MRIVQDTQGRGLERVIQRLPQVADDICDKTANDVLAGSLHDVPRLTGNLARSGGAFKVADMDHRIEYGASYGYFVHFGTRGMSGRPFLLQNSQRQRPAFLAAFRALIRRLT